MHQLQHHARRAGFAVPELAAAATGLASLGASGPSPAGLSPADKDEAPRLAGTEGFTDQGKADNSDSPGTRHAGQALRVIEGETRAAQYPSRLRDHQAVPDELAVIVSMLYGAALRGFCCAIEKALGAHHA